MKFLWSTCVEGMSLALQVIRPGVAVTGSTKVVSEVSIVGSTSSVGLILTVIVAAVRTGSTRIVIVAPSMTLASRSALR